MNIKEFIKHHAVLTYFVLAYSIAWGGILMIVGMFATRTDPTTLVGLVYMPMMIAPGIASVTLTSFIDGRAGLRALLARMTRWQVNIRWYAVALGVMPISVLAVLYALGLTFSPVFFPGLALMMGVAGIFAGFFEEIGWTGFAIPRLLTHQSPFAVGAIVGLLWGLWHALADYSIRGGTLGPFWFVTFSLFVLSVWAWRILMVWVYAKTRSGLVAQLMHFTYTSSLGLFGPILSPTNDALWNGILTLVLWVLVAAVYWRWIQRPAEKRIPAVQH